MTAKEMGRLAMRQEGHQWNAYYALPDTMQDAVFLGSIPLAAIHGNEARRKAFLNMMQGVVSDIIADRIGYAPDWTEPRQAPDHERGGNA